MDNIAYIIILAVGASFVQRTTGFGFGIFIMTLLPTLMPTYGEATALSGMLALVTSGVTAFKMRRSVTWSRLLPILIAFIATSTLSIFLLNKLNDSTIRKVLGVVLILTALWFAFFRNKVRIGTGIPWQAGAGTLSGIMGGLFGMQGPPAVLYFISSESTKEGYMAMTQTYFLIGNMMMTAVRAANGFVTPHVLQCWVPALTGVLAGTLLGSWAFSRIPGRVFPYIVYSYIGISGLIILINN